MKIIICSIAIERIMLPIENEGVKQIKLEEMKKGTIKREINLIFNIFNFEDTESASFPLIYIKNNLTIFVQTI